MHVHNIHELLQDRRFKRIIWRKQRLSIAFALSIIFLFFGFVLVIAFAPGLLSMGLGGERVINLYLLLSNILIIMVCVLMYFFVSLKARDTHDDIRDLIAELKRDEQ